MADTPYELVKEHYTLPFELRPDQEADVNRLAPLPRSGWYDEVGTGKTGMSTVCALYKKIEDKGTVVIILMPPILIKQWQDWLLSIKGVKHVLAYKGKPRERGALSFEGSEWILMSMQIFKKDYVRICDHFDTETPIVLIVDEATSVKNSESDNHHAVRDFVKGRNASLLALTGTPLSTPMDAYGYIALVAPSLYRNRRHFELLHVEERDFFNNVEKWGNLDLMSDNLMCHSSRILKESLGLDQPQYIPIRYELSAPHMALYKKLCEEQFLKLKDGGIINAMSAPKLYNAVQQIIVNWHHFSGDPAHKSAALELVDMVLEELGTSDVDHGEKLMICSNYKMTNRFLLEYLKAYQPVAFYSEVTGAQQTKNYERFLKDPTCRIALVQPASAGFGLDDFKLVCWDLLFLEEPVIPTHFTQVVGRLYRTGQKFAPRVRIGVAEGTIQVRLHHRLLDKSELVTRVQGGFEDLRDAIYGK